MCWQRHWFFTSTHPSQSVLCPLGLYDNRARVFKECPNLYKSLHRVKVANRIFEDLNFVAKAERFEGKVGKKYGNSVGRIGRMDTV